MSNNWHRIMWQLSPPTKRHDGKFFFRKHFYDAKKSNQFWLEPEVYAGPTVTIGKGPARMDFPANTLCFRIRFVAGNMTNPWKNCVLFPRGSKPLTFSKKNDPQPAPDTERLVGTTKIHGKAAALSIYMDTRRATNPAQLRIFAAAHGVGHHLGAGIAHQ